MSDKMVIFLLFACLLIVKPCFSECLTQEQTEIIENVSNSTNVSSSIFISIFENMCSDIENKYNKDMVDTQINLTKEFLKEYIDIKTDFIDQELDRKLNKSINNTNDKINDFEKLIENKTNKYLENISETFEMLDTMDRMLEILNESTNVEKMENIENEIYVNVSEQMTKFEDMFDDKISDFREDFVDNDELKNATDELKSLIYSSTSNNSNDYFMGIYTPYLFLFFVIAGVIVIIGFKTGIIGSKKPPRVIKNSDNIPKKVVCDVEDLGSHSTISKKIKLRKNVKNKMSKLSDDEIEEIMKSIKTDDTDDKKKNN